VLRHVSLQLPEFSSQASFQNLLIFIHPSYLQSSLCLQSENAGCRLSRLIINHLLFADDAVVFAPCAKGLQRPLDICSKFAVTHNVVYNVTKSQCMIINFKYDLIHRHNFSPAIY